MFTLNAKTIAGYHDVNGSDCCESSIRSHSCDALALIFVCQQIDRAINLKL